MAGRKTPQTASYYREYFQRKKAGGLCFHCQEPAEPGKTRCARHAAMMRDVMRRKRERREAA